MKTYNRDDIMKFLPHRDPFLWVDKIDIIKSGEEGIGYKNITTDMDFFRGHFPDNPVMPGVLQIEAMAQTAGCVVMEALQNEANKPTQVFFMSIDKVKFRHMVVPDCQLKMHAQKVKSHGKVYVFEAKAYIEDKLVSEATFSALVS